jgi:hypothetical protein
LGGVSQSSLTTAPVINFVQSGELPSPTASPTASVSALAITEAKPLLAALKKALAASSGVPPKLAPNPSGNWIPLIFAALLI